MVGFDKTQLLNLMDKMDQETYGEILKKVLTQFQIKTKEDLQKPVTIEMLETYIGTVLRPYVAELLEKNNQQLIKDLKSEEEWNFKRARRG